MKNPESNFNESSIAIDIYNMDGVLCYVGHVAENAAIDICFLPMGIYIVRITTTNNQVGFKKIVVR
ncbi:MAG: T9SS type A sorting domain-containing protein [Chitinophagales bacterium]|nr:T9SS type A sorting domain-containing protein [Bacteroidota bacterium]MBK7569413.1 T9SS type A sorting domain-containing protein [Bacteroidota bacterium]MBP8915952.1 T9SS type A sorting domain-containing protein [Chitinophagales bacterium]MBP9220437.1 T9SS type A sorting domain-containing protein [Chitinophagales bacterium]MBP9796303.1 T9SS type A sorting domain-containing protein [Chitinophagales bacterium]